jgi:hypothetical protein
MFTPIKKLNMHLYLLVIIQIETHFPFKFSNLLILYPCTLRKTNSLFAFSLFLNLLSFKNLIYLLLILFFSSFYALMLLVSHIQCLLYIMILSEVQLFLINIICRKILIFVFSNFLFC